jgi:hypothetical protein
MFVKLRRFPIVKLAVAVLVTGLSCGAQASVTSVFSFSGDLEYRYNAWNCPNLTCSSWAETRAWEGLVTVVTDSAADGTYAGDKLLSFQFASSLPNWQGFTTDGKATGSFLPVTLAVTMTGGLLTAVDGGFMADPYERFTMNGLTASYSFGGCHHCNAVTGVATLAPVPEPQTYAMLLAGLGLLVVYARRNNVR